MRGLRSAVSTGAVTGEPRGRASVRPGVRLLWEADALLALVPQLRATGFVANLSRLREQIAALLRDFQTRARSHGIEAGRIEQATEVLAALIDQVATSMPWGAEVGWRSLAAGAAPAGVARAPVSPAARLSQLTRASSSDAGLRELIGVALALGFEGRLSGADAAQIDQVRSQLTAADPKPAPAGGFALSPGASAVERGSALSSWLPLWVVSVALAAALAVLYFALELSLGAKSDRLYARIAALRAPAAVVQALPASQPRLAGVLAEPVTAFDLSVRDEIDRSVIVVPGARLFEAGSATLQGASAELLRSIAAALQGTPGRVQVIGHTDGTVARSARYPSDWELSVDRARTVEEALHALGIDAARLSYDGRAGIEPASGATKAPAADDRIEIVLLAGR